MALPLKSGADLYNNQALRLRLHNLGADPTEVGAGLIYFNTSTGLNTSQKARLYTGSAWKTIAFSEDLDVAKNEDFLALKEKVDTLIGDGVDMDGIIESWKEVEAFLSGMSDTKSLMDLLNDKLSLSEGGNVKKPITVNSEYAFAITNDATGDWSGIRFRIGGTNKGFLGISSTGNPIYIPADQSKMYDIITSAGGTISGALIVEASSPAVTFKKSSDSNPFASLGIFANKLSMYVNSEAKYYDILHSGNVGEYNAGGIASGVATDDYLQGNVAKAWYDWNASTGNGVDEYSYGIYVGAYDTRYGMQLATTIGSVSFLRTRVKRDSAWEDWKTIAFTDSNVASATKLATPRTLWGQSFDGTKDVGGSIYIGSGAVVYNNDATNYYIGCKGTSLATYNMYGGHSFCTIGGTQRMLINTSGNVTIGDSDLAGSDVKLYIADTRESNGYILNARFFSPNLLDGGTSVIIFGKSESANNRAYIGYTHNSDSSTSNAITFGFYGQDKIVNFLANGNVLIGTATDNGSGARLQVAGDISIPNNHYISFNNAAKTPLYQLWMTANDVFFVGRGSVENGHQTVYCGKTIRFSTGDSAWNNSAFLDENGNLHVKGNIIADGEVSAGGAAEEGGNAGGGGAAEKITATIEEGLKFKEISHTLGDNVIVQVYEWNANGQTWDMVLTDVETTTNLVTVRFGNETDVPHKVVII